MDRRASTRRPPILARCHTPSTQSTARTPASAPSARCSSRASPTASTRWRPRCTCRSSGCASARRPCPALVLGNGERIVGSRAIVHRLDALVPEPPLLPTDEAARARVVEAEEWGDRVLQPIPRRLFWVGIQQRTDAISSYAEGSKLPLPAPLQRLVAPLVSRVARLPQQGLEGPCPRRPRRAPRPARQGRRLDRRGRARRPGSPTPPTSRSAPASASWARSATYGRCWRADRAGRWPNGSCRRTQVTCPRARCRSDGASGASAVGAPCGAADGL